MTLVTSSTCRTPDLVPVLPAVYGGALRRQTAGQVLVVGDAHDVAAFDGRLGHAENHACFLALRHRESPRRADFSHACRSVFTHAGHQDGHGLRAKLPGDAVK